MIRQGLGVHLHEARPILSDEARPIGQRLMLRAQQWFGDRDELGAHLDLLQASRQIGGRSFKIIESSSNRQSAGRFRNPSSCQSTKRGAYRVQGPISMLDFGRSLLRPRQGMIRTIRDQP
jgi:hypothetical protein